MKTIIALVALLCITTAAFAWETETAPERNDREARDIAAGRN